MTKTEMVEIALSKGLIKNKTAGSKMPVDDLRKLLEAAEEADSSAGEEVSVPIEAKAELPVETLPGTVGAPTDADLDSIESERPGPVPSPVERLARLRAQLESFEKGAPFSARPRRKLERGIRRLERKLKGWDSVVA